MPNLLGGKSLINQATTEFRGEVVVVVAQFIGQGSLINQATTKFNYKIRVRVKRVAWNETGLKPRFTERF